MMSVLESVFEFLFKYRPAVFERGEFAFTASRPVVAAAVAGLAIALVAALTYLRVRAKGGPADRGVLLAARAAALAVLLFCLLRPVLVLAAAVPQRNFVGVLLDDSRSMQIADRDGLPRSDFVLRTFDGQQSAVMRALADRFALRVFRYSRATERIESASELTFAGGQTDIAQALDRARQELAAVPLAGLVVVTDGADNAARFEGGRRQDAPALTESLLSLRARGVPVFTVGVGREQFAKDIELGRVEAPRDVLKGTSLLVDVTVAQSGYAGSSVRLQVEDAGRIVAAQEVELPPDGQAAPVRVHVTATEAGPRIFRFRIAPQPGEMVLQNNELEALVNVHDRRERILYFEGEPRFELKFTRRAVADDPNLQLVTLLRTAENKFLRLDVNDSIELVGGFPRTREELFAYRAIILGSVEASAFTHDQLRMIADFVSQRGGGLLMLGGPHAFAEGGYAGTPLADVLPVVLESGEPPGDSSTTELRVEVTPSGATHSATQLAPSERESAARWRALPALTAVNRVQRTKPGATTLLVGAPSAVGARHVVLAHQRYGRGKAIAFPVQDSWLWQMHADIAVDDLTHETFWRQLLRWLTSNVPDQVGVSGARDGVSPGEPVILGAEVSDETFVRVNGAEVVAQVTDPAGARHDVPLEWAVDRDGEYRATFTPAEAGVYALRLEARKGDKVLASAPAYIRAAPQQHEYFDAEMRVSLLERIAEETGGRFYTEATVGSLPEDITYSRSGATVQEEKELWDMPALFLLLVALVAGEWGYRRVKGLA
jgi:uncharacterized membrane protein